MGGVELWTWVAERKKFVANVQETVGELGKPLPCLWTGRRLLGAQTPAEASKVLHNSGDRSRQLLPREVAAFPMETILAQGRTFVLSSARRDSERAAARVPRPSPSSATGLAPQTLGFSRAGPSLRSLSGVFPGPPLKEAGSSEKEPLPFVGVF